VLVVAPKEDVRRFYAAADVLVSASRAEGMPFAVLEALSSGVPVVASDISGHAFVGQHVPACIVTAGDPRSLAKGIETVLGWDSARREEDLRLSRQWIVEHMHLTSWGDQVMRTYRDLLPGNVARPGHRTSLRRASL
jgi:glycosyltransferase involved in cell wall biosynthesis